MITYSVLSRRAYYPSPSGFLPRDGMPDPQRRLTLSGIPVIMHEEHSTTAHPITLNDYHALEQFPVTQTACRFPLQGIEGARTLDVVGAHQTALLAGLDLAGQQPVPSVLLRLAALTRVRSLSACSPDGHANALDRGCATSDMAAPLTPSQHVAGPRRHAQQRGFQFRSSRRNLHSLLRSMPTPKHGADSFRESPIALEPYLVPKYRFGTLPALL